MAFCIFVEDEVSLVIFSGLVVASLIKLIVVAGFSD